MKINMREWTANMIASRAKTPMPILSFPCVQLMDITVRELISNSELQAKGMLAVAKRVSSSASVSLMDLSVEAECFGSTIRFSDDEVPTVVGAVVTTQEEAEALEIPAVGSGRTGIYVDAIAKATELITDRPVLAGIIGPFSLAGRLLDVSEAMILCYDEPDMVHTVLEKVTAFSIEYCKAYKKVGANGVVIAEPLAGLLSPALAEEFSHTYVKQIVEAVQEDDFAVIYHNCGDNVARMVKDIYNIGAMGYHFGNAIRMIDVVPNAPSDVIVMGNISPADYFKNGTPEDMKTAVPALIDECGKYPNFVISSGCDIPPLSSWDNIDAFFEAVENYYSV